MPEPADERGDATERILPFGSWPSPLTAERLASGGVGVGAAASRTSASGEREVWWTEARPAEAGRVVLVRRLPDGRTVDALPAPWSVRTRVHEYGGGAWFHGPDHVYFSSWDDQRLYRIPAATAGVEATVAPEAVTPEPEVPHGWRFADGVITPDGAWLVCVSEDHHPEVVAEHGEAVNALVAIPAEGGEPIVLSQKTDFVAAPRVSPDGRWLSWYSWDHPNMPWDETTLCAAPLWTREQGSSKRELRIGNVKVVAGGSGSQTSVHSSNWTADGQLLFSDDRTGWWNVYSWKPGDDDAIEVTSLEGSEIGSPPWVFGHQRWSELDDGRLFAVTITDAIDDLVEVMSDGTLRPVPTPFATVQALRAHGSELLITGFHADRLPSIVSLDPASGDVSEIRASDDLGVDPSWFSRAEAIRYDSNGRTAHAFFYEPAAPGISGPADERPPLVVMGHGGPTSLSDPSLNLKVQYWTSRGFAVVDVNYGGSGGFGRAYRSLLDDAWGIVDVEDCINAARHLGGAGRVDSERMVIRGGSAGGFTVLTALATSDVFAAGTSLYGVADLTALATDTHKFESRYLDGLIGPYPEARSVYEARSPINHTGGFQCPLLVMQGDEDEIVPPNQSEAIVAALAEKGIPHAYLLFEGEQHGFRQAANLIRSFEAELWFYGRVLGFDPADGIDPVAGAVGLG